MQLPGRLRIELHSSSSSSNIPVPQETQCGCEPCSAEAATAAAALLRVPAVSKDSLCFWLYAFMLCCQMVFISSSHAHVLVWCACVPLNRQYVQNRRKLELRYKGRLNTHSGDYAYTA